MARLLKTLSVVLAVGFSSLLASPHVRAGSVPTITGPQDVSQLNATLNGIIANINAVLIPLSGPTLPGAASGILISQVTSGAPTISSYSLTGATNVNLKIDALGSGKIILFDSTNPLDFGILKVASAASWVAATGLAACPGGLPARPTMNGSTSGVVTGYWLVQDWKESVHAIPTC